MSAALAKTTTLEMSMAQDMCPLPVISADPKYHWTPLHGAARNGHLEIVQKLLAKGADPNAKNENGYTALHFTSQAGKLEVIRALLADKRTEINIKDNLRRTPLYFASREGHVEIVQLLLDNGAEPNVD